MKNRILIAVTLIFSLVLLMSCAAGGSLSQTTASPSQSTHSETDEPSADTTHDYEGTQTVDPEAEDADDQTADIQSGSSSFDVGEVKITSNGIDYLPDRHLVEKIESSGGLTGSSYSEIKSTPLSPATIGWNEDKIVPVTSDTEVYIEGDTYSKRYALYTPDGEVIYEDEPEFLPPDAEGDYKLFIDVVWGDAENFAHYQYFFFLRLQGTISAFEGIEIFSLTPSTQGVDDFVAMVGEVPSNYENDTCFNVTPADITQKYGYTVFKYDQSCASLLMFNGRMSTLGSWFGGFGVHNFAVADVNGDGRTELYFAYSSGSGLHRSSVGYYDSATGVTTLFETGYEGEDVVLGAEDGAVCVYIAQEVDSDSFVDMKFTPGEKVATVAYSDGEIVLAE